MTVYEALAAHMEDQKLQQKEVALSFLEALRERGGRAYKPETVISRLSELVNGKEKGVSFFAEKPLRLACLLDALALHGAERDEMAGALEAAARTAGKAEVRCVLDLTAIDQPPEVWRAVFDQLEHEMPGWGRALPAEVLVTTEQYRWIPRTFDEVDQVSVRRFERAADAQAVVCDHAEAGGVLVLSQLGRLPLQRSAIPFIEDRRLGVEPPDAIETWSARGRLPSPNEVEHELGALGIEPAEEVTLPSSPAELRRLPFVLADEEAAEQSGLAPSVRLALAQQLGAAATSTPQERIEVQLAQAVDGLGLEAPNATEQAWEGLVARAARRPTGPLARRVGDEIRVLNPDGELPAHPRLRVVHRTCEAAVFTRMLEATHGWTTDHWTDDPALHGVAARLVEGGADPGLVAHARATILHGRLVEPVQPKPDVHGVEALRAILAHSPPSATLLLEAQEPPHERVVVAGGKLTLVAGPPVITSGECASISRSAGAMGQAPPIGPVVTRRADQPGPCLWHRHQREHISPHTVAVVAIHSQSAPEERLALPPQHHAPEVLIPLPVDGKLNAEDWRDAVEHHLERPLSTSGLYELAGGKRQLTLDEAWVSERPDVDQALRIVRLMPRSLPRDSVLSTLTEVPIPVAEDLWDEADLQIGTLWLALGRALQRPHAVQLHDGRTLLDLGGSVVAELAARRHGDDRRPVDARLATIVSVKTVVGTDVPAVESTLDMIITRTAWTRGARSPMQHELPRHVQLVGAGYAVDITFRPSPFGPESGHL